MALAVGVPTLLGLRFREQPTGLSRRVFEVIEVLPPGSRVLMAFDFDPASEGELGPMATAFTRHCAERGHRPVFLCLWPIGEQMIAERIDGVLKADFPAMQEGVDYANLGFKSGNEGVIKVISTDLRQMYPTDRRGIALDQIPLLRDVTRASDFDLIVSVSAGQPGTKEWVLYAATPDDIPIVAGATGVQSPGLYPYTPRQLQGLLAAIKGAADYETLVADKYGDENGRDREARRRMGPQLFAHLLIIGLIVAGNIAFARQRRQPPRPTPGTNPKPGTGPDERRPWGRPALLLTLGALAAWAYVAGNGRAYVSTDAGAVSAATASETITGQAVVSMPRTAGLWIAAGMTLAVFSFLWADNPVYKFAEAILVGVSAAYWMVVAFWTVIVPLVLVPLFPAATHPLAPGLPPVREDGWWLTIVPVILGGMLLMRLSPRGGWIARWPLALIIGTTAGLKLVGYLQADFLSQIRATAQPLIVTGSGGVVWAETIRATLLVTATLAAVGYFFFSAEHRGPMGVVSRLGIWVLMITFGAAFAYTVMGRIALLQIRLEFLFDDWLWLIDPAGGRFALPAAGPPNG